MNRRIAFGLRSVAVLALLAGSCGLSCAAARADALTGPSVGEGVGEYYLRINNAAGLGTALDSYSTHNTAWPGFIQYRFAPFVALEAQYMNLGTGTGYGPGPTQYTSSVRGWAPWRACISRTPIAPTRSG